MLSISVMIMLSILVVKFLFNFVGFLFAYMNIFVYSYKAFITYLIPLLLF